MESKTVDCSTERKEYVQGDSVLIHIKNNSSDSVRVVDRDYVDGGFAAIEIKGKEEAWEAIELIAAANIITFKTLSTGEYHDYIWKTRGYNRSDTLAIPGVYRIVFSESIKTNEFLIEPPRVSRRPN